MLKGKKSKKIFRFVLNETTRLSKMPNNTTISRHKYFLKENKKRAVIEYREEKIQIQKAIWMAKLAEENNKIKRKRIRANRMLPLFRSLR